MEAIQGVYEVAIKVRNLERSEAFYRGVLQLEDGLRDEPRRWNFLRAGSGMVVLQEDTSGTWPTQHFAFTVRESDLVGAAQYLRERGVTTRGPVTHDWIPAKSLYFTDPDGHELEFCAPL